MKITWIGHACFRVDTNAGSVVLDPYADGAVPGLEPVRENANLVLCSHGHRDHNAPECVNVTPAAGDGLKITKIATWHDDAQGTKRGPNTIHILETAEGRVAHLGDLGCALEPEQAELLKGLDVLMIPVGGFFTIDGVQAAEICRQLQPKHVIPMHFRNPGFGYDVISTVDCFTEQMGACAMLPGAVFDTTEQIPEQVLVLTPQNMPVSK